MAHNSKRNRRDITAHDDEDYVYPTAKVRENKTRARNYDRSLIKKGLADFENLEINPFADEDEWYGDDDMGQTSEEQKNADEYEEDDINDFDSHMSFDDVNTKWDHRWEDY